jgi:hypothetical protein
VAAAPVTCPFCNTSEWKNLPKGIILRDADPRVIRGGGSPAVGFVCVGCGFIRLQMPMGADPAE